jgi:hypothetical protein
LAPAACQMETDDLQQSGCEAGSRLVPCGSARSSGPKNGKTLRRSLRGRDEDHRPCDCGSRSSEPFLRSPRGCDTVCRGDRDSKHRRLLSRGLIQSAVRPRGSNHELAVAIMISATWPTKRFSSHTFGGLGESSMPVTTTHALVGITNMTLVRLR